jgi:hypothetical protein
MKRDSLGDLARIKIFDFSAGCGTPSGVYRPFF